MKYLYGNSWERFQINENEIWIDSKTDSRLSICNIIEKLPNYMYAADMIYCDPPWSLGNVNCFYTKAERSDYILEFSSFYKALFNHIRNINASVCYLEIGKQNKHIFVAELVKIYSHIQVWDIKYYSKNPCFLIRGSSNKIGFDYTNLDDTKTPLMAIQNENINCVADFCTGTGLTAIAAFKCGKKFVGTDINKRRLAVTIEKVNKLGAQYESSIS